MLYFKTLHIILIVSWFAGLFYLPRIFVNLALDTEPAAARRLLTMARKLYRFMTFIAIPAAGSGLWLWLFYGVGQGQGWPHAKLGIAIFLLIYHAACGHLLHRFEQGRNPRSDRWYRYFNELPALGLITATWLAVLKPF